ncbi:MAG: hypothetical protein H6564_13065 [Lewinellaceae bacterium]|nr:hypothetical protein [Lewinellaceae bacterium]
MKKKNIHIALFVVLDILAAIATFAMFYSILEGGIIKRNVGQYVLIILIGLLIFQFSYLIIKFVKSISAKRWKSSTGWLIFLLALGLLTYGVLFVAMIYWGLLGNYTEGF